MIVNSNLLIFERQLKLNKEHLYLRLFKQSDGLMLERELIEGDGSSRSQALPIISLEYLQIFIVADPYYDSLKGSFELLMIEAKKHYEVNF